MSETKRCPACHAKLLANEDRCPKCGLEDLNRIFISREDYEEWVEKCLKPHKAKLQPKVSAGYSHALILFAFGDLYGIGNNDSGQLGEEAPLNAEEPCLIARNVKSASAGYNYSIYATEEGDVKLLGTGGFIDRFEGFAHAKEVFAADFYDGFFIKAEDGSFFTFGDNQSGFIEFMTEKEQYVFPDETVTVNYRNEGGVTIVGTQGSSAWEYSWDNCQQQEMELRRELVEREPYPELVRQYGENNLVMELLLLSEKNVGEYTPKSYYKERVYRPRVMLYNKEIYTPVLKEQTYTDAPVYTGNCPEMAKSEFIDLLQEDTKKIICFKYVWCMELKKNGRLSYFNFQQYKIRGRKEENVMRADVRDVSISRQILILSDHSGNVFYGYNKDIDVKLEDISLRKLMF